MYLPTNQGLLERWKFWDDGSEDNNSFSAWCNLRHKRSWLVLSTVFLIKIERIYTYFEKYEL
jgi:hypothetical protein